MKEIVTYLPLNYNDKSKVDFKLIKGFAKEMTTKYGGCTLGSRGMGFWVNEEHDRIDEDKNVMMTVAVSEDQIPEIREDVIRIGKILKQDGMYFKVIDCHVEIIDT